MVVGVCMHTDRIEPFVAVTKEVELVFSFGYTPDEFAATLGRLAAGVPGADRLITLADRPSRRARGFRPAAHPGRARQDRRPPVTPTAPPAPTRDEASA